MVPSQVNNYSAGQEFHAYKEPQVSSPYSQKSAARLYPVPTSIWILINFKKAPDEITAWCHCNVIFPCTPKSPKSSFTLTYNVQNFVCFFHFLMLATCAVHLILLDLIFPVMQVVERGRWSSSFCNFINPVTFRFLGPNFPFCFFSIVPSL
jgi:hypothetical protein